MQMGRVTFTPQALVAAHASSKRASLAGEQVKQFIKVWRDCGNKSMKMYWKYTLVAQVEYNQCRVARGDYDLSYLVDNDDNNSDDDRGAFISGGQKWGLQL